MAACSIAELQLNPVQDTGAGFRKHRDLGSSIKHLSLHHACLGHQRATDTDHSRAFISKEACSWTTTGKSMWPDNQRLTVLVVFLYHEASLLQHFACEKQVPDGSTSNLLGMPMFLIPIRGCDIWLGFHGLPGFVCMWSICRTLPGQSRLYFV